MGKYVLRRLLGAIPLLLGVATLIFFVLALAPGDPTASYFSPNLPAATLEQLRHNFGLDQPIYIRYLKWMGQFLTGHFGYSYAQARPVSAILWDAIPNTLVLCGISLVLVFVIGVLAGVVQAVKQNSFLDGFLSITSLFFYSMPPFWLALMLMLIFSLQAHIWGWPIALPSTGITNVNYEFFTTAQKFHDRLIHLILPVSTLTLALVAGLSRYTRGQMLEVIRQDYIRTARAKGLPERRVILHHALRNSLIPVITLFGLYLPLLFSGTVFVEVIYAWPGMGRVIVDAIFQRDYPVVMATSFLFAVMVVLGSLVADILYAVVDPRVRYD